MSDAPLVTSLCDIFNSSVTPQKNSWWNLKHVLNKLDGHIGLLLFSVVRMDKNSARLLS